MGTDHREAFHVGKPCLKMLALVTAILGLLNLGQACWMCLQASQVTSTRLGKARQSLTLNTKGTLFNWATYSVHRKSPMCGNQKGLYQTS